MHSLVFLFEHEIETKFLLTLITLFHLSAEKLEQAENQLAHSRIGPLGPPRKKEVSIIFVICVVVQSYSEANFVCNVDTALLSCRKNRSLLRLLEIVQR